MALKTFRCVLLTAGAGAMLVAMVAVMPAAATSASSGQGYTWTTIHVSGSYATVPITVNDRGVVVGSYSSPAATGLVAYRGASSNRAGGTPRLMIRWGPGNCSGLVSPSTPRVEGARIVGNSD